MSTYGHQSGTQHRRRLRRRLVFLKLIPACAAVAFTLFAMVVVAAQQPQELPRFRSSVELTPMDVGVFDDRGQPIADLKPEDFIVRVDGNPRRVVNATWIPLEAPPGPTVKPPPDGYTANDNATGGRLILLVVDQPNIRFGGAITIRRAANAFIDRLQPADRAAVIGIGPGSPSVGFTADRVRLKKAIEAMVGQHRNNGFRQHNIALSEALDIRQGRPGILENVIARECAGLDNKLATEADRQMCVAEVQREADELAMTAGTDGQDTIAALRAILTALRGIDAPKTMVLLSEGFLMEDQMQEVTNLGTLSAAARTSIYALRLDDQSFSADASDRFAPMAPMNDRFARGQGMETLVAASRGALFNVIGTGETIFEHITAELSGYYLLGVESGPTDKDGKTHPIRVDVVRKGLTVRSRRALINATEIRKPRNAREAILAALETPLPVSALPLRVATYSLQGPEADKVQILIHADVGSDYSASRVVSLGYLITDESGRVVDSQMSNARLQPVMNGVPSALQYAGGASLAPGEYTLKLAVAEGDRVGTVEHKVHAGVLPAASLRVSDLMVGGPAALGEQLLQPTVGYSVVFGVLHGYLEAYGNGASGLTATYEIVADEAASPLLEAEVTPRMAGESRAIFTHLMPIRQLPPGQYTLRVRLAAAGQTVKVATRPFEVATPAVLMTSASSSAVTMPTDVYLPVSEAMLSRGFNVGDVSRKDTVQSFRARVPDKALPAFDKGVQALSSGSYPEAEATLKSAIDPDTDSSAIIAYLAAVFAAVGNDQQAAGAWQTALIDGSEFPQVYEWLAGSLLRTRDLSTARSMLEEAVSKWPSDSRFARPMALVYATLGQGPEAMRALERHLAAHKDDIESLFMGVEWIYQLHSAGVTLHTPAEDLKLAKSYADAYTKAKGPQAALVKQWVGFLENKNSR
jgi:VWFA-related protein